MGSLRARLIDRNRYAKRYPFVKSPARLVYQGDEYMALEIGSIYFDGTDTGTLVFEAPFTDTSYQIIAQPRDKGGNGSANVITYIDDTNTDRTQAVIKTSAPFTGYVDILAVRLGA